MSFGRHLKSVIVQRVMFRQISLRNLVFPHIIIMFKLLICMCGSRNADDNQEPETLIVSVEFGL